MNVSESNKKDPEYSKSLVQASEMMGRISVDDALLNNLHKLTFLESQNISQADCGIRVGTPKLIIGALFCIFSSSLVSIGFVLFCSLLFKLTELVRPVLNICFTILDNFFSVIDIPLFE